MNKDFLFGNVFGKYIDGNILLVIYGKIVSGCGVSFSIVIISCVFLGKLCIFFSIYEIRL